MKKTLKLKLEYLIRKPFPIIKNTVFFQSFGGQYNDNPKYISEKLHELRPDICIVWAISNEKSNNIDIPDYVKKVKPNSKEYIKYVCRSQVLIDNMTGFRGFVSDKNKKFISQIFKSKKQLNISTWHGVPLKHIGLDMPEMKNKKFMYTNAKYISSGTKYSEEIFKKAFYPSIIKMNGSPRNDILVNKKYNINELKSKLGLPKEKKIILFAPTFRYSAEESGIRQMNELDINKVISLFEKKMGDEWVFVFRVHHEVLNKIDYKTIIKKYNNKVLEGNSHDDMAEYLAVSDCLITDYSGTMFDYMLTKKPAFLLTLDKKNYIEDERGIYMSLDELPYDSAENIEDFYKLIENYNVIEHQNRIEEFLSKIGNYEDGFSSERISKEIIEFVDKSK